jgi:tellurite methyltransferase
VIRTILGFRQDENEDWVVRLSCLHSQHVRHAPPFQERGWVRTEEGRAARIGSDIDCRLCDRAELPEGLRLARTAGPFDAATLPAGLRKEHRIAEATWGVLRVIQGSVRLSIATDPAITVGLTRGERQSIPPGVPHSLTLDGPFRLAIDFLVAEGEEE